MGTAILPAQDCLTSYKAKHSVAANGRASHQANMLQAVHEVSHTKSNLRGRNPDYERSTDPQPVPRSQDFERRRWSSHSGMAFAASQAISSGNLSNGIWYSQSFRSSEKISRPQSTPPLLDSVFYAQQSYVHQSVSSHYFQDGKYSMANTIANHEVRGKKFSQQSKQIVMEEVTILKRGETYKGKDFDRKNQAREKPPSCRVSVVETLPSYQRKNKVIWASKTAASGNGDEVKTNAGMKPTNPEKMFDSLVITSTDPLGPDPSVLPKEGSGIVQSVSEKMKATETSMGYGSQKESVSFVGDGFSQVGSPPTRCDNVKSFDSPVFEMENYWAGPAYSNSPPPSSLPVPKFSKQQMRSISGDLIEASESFNKVGEAMKHAYEQVQIGPIAMGKAKCFTALDQSHNSNIQVGFDVSATQDLRRLLRLD